MRQRMTSIDESTCAYENAADAERMIQRRVSRYEATLASENEDHTAWMRQ